MSYEPDTNDIRLRQLKEEIAKIREEQFARALPTNNVGSPSLINSDSGIPAPAIGVTSIIPAVIRVTKDTGETDILNFENKSGSKDFTLGETVTGNNSGATGIVGDIDNLTSTTGILFFVPNSITGNFQDGENLNGSGAGGNNIADADGTQDVRVGRGHLGAGAGSIIADAENLPREIHFIDNAQQDGQIIYLRAQDSQVIRLRRPLTSDGTTGNLDTDESFDIIENALVFLQYQVASDATPTGGWVPLISDVVAGAGGGTSSFPILYPKQNLGTLNGVIDLPLNQADGHYKQITLDGDASLTFSNIPTSSFGFKFYVLTIQDGVGGHVYTSLPSSVINAGTLLGQLQTGANAQTLWQFSTADGGVNWHAQVVTPTTTTGGGGTQTPWLSDIDANTFNLFNLDVLRYADGTGAGADGIIGFNVYGSAVEDDTKLKWSIPRSGIGNPRSYEWQFDLVPAMTLQKNPTQEEWTLDMLFEGDIANTKGISFFHSGGGTLSSITPGALETRYENGFGAGQGGLHAFYVALEPFASFEIRQESLRANKNLDMITNDIFDVDNVKWASTGGFISSNDHGVRAMGGGSTGIELNTPFGKTFRILSENIGLTDSNIEYEFTNNEVFFNSNQIKDILGITFTNGVFFADLFSEFAIIGGRQGTTPNVEPQPMTFKSQELTGFDTYVTRDIFTIDAREFFGGGGMKMHTDLNLQTQNINNVDVLKFIPDGGVIVGTEYAMGADVGDVAFNFNVPSTRDYIFNNNAFPIAVLDPTGLQLLASGEELSASLDPQMGAREFALTGAHTNGIVGMLDGSFRLVGSDVFVHTGGNPVNLSSGFGTSFVGFTADDDLNMGTFNIFNLDVLRFTVDGGVIGFGEYGISADAGNFSMNFSVPSGKGYGFQDNLDPIAFLSSQGLNLLTNAGFSDPAFIGRELILQTNSFGTSGQNDGQFRLVGSDVIIGSGSGLVNLTTLSAGGADNLGNHIATQPLNMAGNSIINFNSWISSDNHSTISNPTFINWNVDSLIHFFRWTANSTTTLMELDQNALDVNNKQILRVLDPLNPQDSATKNYVDTQIATVDVSQWSIFPAIAPVNMDDNLFVNFSGWTNSLSQSFVTDPSGAHYFLPSGDIFDVFIAGTNKFQVTTGVTDIRTILDVNNNKIVNVGTPTNPNDGTNKAYVDSQVAGVTEGQAFVNWTGSHFFAGSSVSFGDSVLDLVTFTSRINSDFIPSNSTFDLGSSSLQWNDLFVTGLAQIDTLTLTSGSVVNNISNSSGAGGSSTLMTANAIQTLVSSAGGVSESDSPFWTGSHTFNGSQVAINSSTISLGNSTSDNIFVFGRIDSNFIPDDLGRDLGDTTRRWDAFLRTVDLSGNLDMNNNNIIACDDIEINGDLNHDGSRMGFFGTFPQLKGTVNLQGTNLFQVVATLADLLDQLRDYGMINTNV